MRSFFFLLLILFPALFLSADVETFQVVWEPGSGAERLWPTALGYVYRLPFCGSDETLLYCPTHGRNAADCSYINDLGNRIEGGILEAEFPKARKKGLKEKRFVVIEFYIRAFPGRQKARSAAFDIRLLNSPQQIDGASYDTLNSITHLNSDNNYVKFTSRYQRVPKTRDYELMVPPYNRPRFAPDFEPVGIRVIFDIIDGMLSVEYNGHRMPFRKVETVRARTPYVRNFAITTRSSISPSYYRTEYLELSSATLRRCKTLADVESLAPMKFIPYSYADYPLIPKKNQDLKQYVRRHNNPDVQYAQALRLLYGGGALCDPDTAIDLLKTARSKKHALALYELGVCYWRGYGVKQSPAKARGYLEDAYELGCRKAGALLYLMKRDELGRPWFEQPSLYRVKQKYAFPSSGYEYSVLFNCLSEPPYTFKSLNAPGAAGRLVKSPGRDELLVDYAIGKEWPYAYYCRYRDLNGFSAQLKEGYRAGDVMLLPKIWDLEFKAGEKLTVSEFTPERTLLYGDDPVYLALSWLAENPESPGAAFWRGEKPWPKNPDDPSISTEIRMLYAFYRLGRIQENWVPDGFKSKSRQNKNNMLRPWFEYITRAADAGITQAEYFMGRQWFYGDVFPSMIGAPSEIVCRNQARKYLGAAAKKGHFKAALLYSELDLASKFVDPAADTRNYLDALCKRNLGRAWLLKANAFNAMRRPKEYEACCHLAAKYGEPRGFYYLALEQKKDTAEYRRFWNDFISADRELRRRDKQDFYWPDLYELYGKWIDKALPQDAENSNPPRVRFPGVVRDEGLHSPNRRLIVLPRKGG